MAIKISGNTVIDDSRNVLFANTVTATSFQGDGSQLTNLNLPVEVIKPTNINPTDGATGIDGQASLCGSDYFSLYGKTHACTCYQVSECSDFSNCNVFTCEVAGANTNLVVPENCLSISTQYFFRLRYEDQDGCCSQFSDTTCFTTADVFFAFDLGESACGGFYAGAICAAGTCYYLILAPNSGGALSGCRWDFNAPTTTGATSGVDGYNNSYCCLTGGNFNSARWAATRSIGGFTDWYLPGLSELSTAYFTGGPCLPGGEGFGAAQGTRYWSSTEANVTCANTLYPFPQINQAIFKACPSIPGQGPLCTRAMRREPMNPT